MPKVSVADVAQQLRGRLPELGTKKLHALLYCCQGHHLATFGTPLFHDSISAWDMGPVVDQLWYDEKRCTEGAGAAGTLTESELNTVGYVVSHYGELSGNELERLTHNEAPWLEANAHRDGLGTSQEIPPETLRRHFSGPHDHNDAADFPDPVVVATWLADADEATLGDPQIDCLGELRVRLTTQA